MPLKTVTRNPPTFKTPSWEQIKSRLLEVLKKHASQRGLTNSELVKKSGTETRRSLATLHKIKGKEAGAEHLKPIIYDLWRSGLVFVEPPNRGQKVGRIWDIDSARNIFPHAAPATVVPERPRPIPVISQHALKDAYDSFVPEHLAGFVPIFKVRRKLSWPREDFDRLLIDLNQRNDPVIELHAGDPADLSAEEKRDSLWLQAKLLVRMRWRES
jgi:hypothetical protein